MIKKAVMPKSQKKTPKRPVRSIESLVHPKPFRIPPAFFRMLEEFSSGGWILIMAGEGGNPELYAKYENALAQLALVKYGKEYFTMADATHSQQIMLGGIANNLVSDDDDL